MHQWLLEALCAGRRLVSNLADGVTDEDIKELFESCGEVKYAGINWDRRSASHPPISSIPSIIPRQLAHQTSALQQ